jgi:membrane protein implicated in regulation of membrane protease activity
VHLEARLPNGTRPTATHSHINLEGGPDMTMLFYGFLFLALAVLVIGLLLGLAFKLVGFAVAALLVVAGVSWIMHKLGRSTDTDRERLSR